MNDHRRATRWRSPDEPCLNCGDTTTGRFCPTCGQRKAEVLVSVRALLADVLEDQLVLNRALPRTIGALLFRPGFLTSEYVRGRIVRYIAPFRLYLVSSVVFFLLLSFVGLQGLQVGMTASSDDVAAIDSAAAAAVDSITAARTARQALADIDTTGMPPAARAALRESLRDVEQRLDSAIRAATNAAGAAPTDTARLAPATPDSTSATDPEGDTDVVSYEELLQLDSDTALPPGALQPWARRIDFDDSQAVFQRALLRKLAQVGHLPHRDAIREVLRDLLEYAPHMVFLLLPLFALILKLLYIRRSRYYAEHFVFALHVHAFVFTMFTVMFVLPWDWINGLFLLWIVLYVWLALRHVYRQGWVRTTAKWWTLGATYLFFFLFGLVGLAVVTLLLT
jgi:hypothetical protein